MTNRMTRQALLLGLTALWLAVPAAWAAPGTGVEQVWTAQYNGPGNYTDNVEDLAVRDGYVYVTGWAHSSYYSRRYGTVKYDYDGQEIWSHVYSTGTGESEAVAVDAAGNVYVTG